MSTTATLNFPRARGRSSSVGLWLGLVVVLGYWAVTIWRLGGMWSAFPEYSYGWAVPMLCVMLFLERWRSRSQAAGREQRAGSGEQGAGSRERRQNPPLTPPGRGTGMHDSTLSKAAFCFLLSALLLFILARLCLELNPTWRLMAWVMALTVITLTLLMLRLLVSGQWSVVSGQWSRFRASHFAFPICFFLLAVPWHTRIEVPFIQALTQLNAAVTVELMAFLKIAAVRMGNIILIEPGMVGVQEACSGIRSFQSTMMVALFLGELFRFTFWRRVAFVVLGAFLSFGFNIVRTSFLVWTCNREGLGAVDKFHDPAGWTILAASVTGLGLIGWWLYRGTRSEERGAGSGERSTRAEMLKTEIQDESQNRKSEIGNRKSEATSDLRLPTSVPDGSSNSSPWSRGLVVLAAMLLSALVGTELGLRWWFATHEQAHREVANWTATFAQPSTINDQTSTSFKALKITKEVQAMLNYDRGGGWEWQGGGAERWQAFQFTWEKPKTLARRIACMAGALGHQPEVCFTAAGMQLRQNYGRKTYTANGVPLVFKVYEFTDRNIPIFVFTCTWERNADPATAEELHTEGIKLSGAGIRQAVARLARGDRGLTDEVRVLKFGVWGPRTIGEAEASFQQQLNQLIQPKAGPPTTDN